MNVIYQNVCHTLKFMNLPEYSGHCWFGLRNSRWRPRWPPEINARGCFVRIGVLIRCILFHQINDIYFVVYVELFNDTFKYGFNVKVKVKYEK